MLQGTTAQDMAAEITRIARTKVDVVQDTRQMQYTHDGLLLVDGAGQGANDGGVAEYTVRPWAERQIGERLGIPRKYWERMQAKAPELLATNVNHWFNENPDRRLVRTLDGQVRAFLSDRYLRMDHYDVAQHLLPVITEAGCTIASCGLTEQRMYIKATLPSLAAEITRPGKVGDVVFAGVYIGNSEIGAGSMEVYPLTEVLACTNGMVHKRYGMTRRHVGKRIADDEVLAGIMSQEALAADDKAMWLALRDLVQAALSEVQFNAIVADMQAAADSAPIRKPIEGIKVLANQLALDDGEADGVLGHLVAGGDLSAWGTANALTRYAQDVADYDRSTELEVAGDLVLAMPQAGTWQQVALAGSR